MTTDQRIQTDHIGVTDPRLLELRLAHAELEVRVAAGCLERLPAGASAARRAAATRKGISTMTTQDTTTVTMRRCIGSRKFGIEEHDAPASDFPVQPSQKDGLGRMCKTDWNRYTNALRKATLARKATEATPAAAARCVPVTDQPLGEAQRRRHHPVVCGRGGGARGHGVDSAAPLGIASQHAPSWHSTDRARDRAGVPPDTGRRCCRWDLCPPAQGRGVVCGAGSVRTERITGPASPLAHAGPQA